MIKQEMIVTKQETSSGYELSQTASGTHSYVISAHTGTLVC